MKTYYQNHKDKENLAYAREMRRHMTPEESKLWFGFLKRYPIRFVRQKRIAGYIADFYCAKGKLIIEVDGIHHYTPKQREYDEKRSKVLMDWGYAVFRIDNDWIKNNFYEVCKYIDEMVMERTGIDIRKLYGKRPYESAPNRPPGGGGTSFAQGHVSRTFAPLQKRPSKLRANLPHCRS